jgi:hypothetical protein
MAILNNSNAISSGGYDINNSLRFRASASAYLNRTPGSATNRKTWTFSAWIKRGALSSVQAQALLSSYTSNTDTNYSSFLIDSNNFLYFGGGATDWLRTTQVFRDPSAWYHLVFVLDTTQATAANRIKLYVNGNQVTAFSTANYPAQNADLAINQAGLTRIGYDSQATYPYDGYMAEVNFIDGQALTPSSFGETDTTTGSWKPKAYTGTYGTNGFYLKFSDIATTSGSNAGLGKDFSGNTNYWTTNNISVTAGTTYDAMIDSPTLTSATVANYAVMNPLNAISITGGNTTTLSNANLSVLMPNTAGSRTAFATMGVSSGKWYWETTITTGSINTYYPGLGIDTNLNALPTDQSGGTASGYMYLSNGEKLISASLAAYGSSFTTNDVIGVALDMDAGTITFYKNNTSQGQAFSGITGTAVPCVIGQNNAALAINFGQRPFTYTPPTGFVRLNTYNLPDSTIKKGNTVMDATLWTGNGTSQSITNFGAFKPDFVWVKDRTSANGHDLYDSVRGTTKSLSSGSTAAEQTLNGVTAFNTNGFSVGNEGRDNANTDAYVGWQWQAGQGSTSSNTSGTITSTVSTNATAGFSVVTYTGNGTSGATIGHGLGVVPRMFIVKRRTGGTGAWTTYHASVGNTKAMFLDQTSAGDIFIGYFNNTSPTSSVFSVGNDVSVNANTSTYVAYCWAEIAGFSKAFSYTGNGSTDGPMVYLGFKPKFIIAKRTDTTGDWVMTDSSRSPSNVVDKRLFANVSDAESSATTPYDYLSNGFKLRNTNANENASGGTYIGMAFASNPFKNSNAV